MTCASDPTAALHDLVAPRSLYLLRRGPAGRRNLTVGGDGPPEFLTDFDFKFVKFRTPLVSPSGRTLCRCACVSVFDACCSRHQESPFFPPNLSAARSALTRCRSAHARLLHTWTRRPLPTRLHHTEAPHYHCMSVHHSAKHCGHALLSCLHPAAELTSYLALCLLVLPCRCTARAVHTRASHLHVHVPAGYTLLFRASLFRLSCLQRSCVP